jgi:glyoxylate/hydroxypyruvate reductase
MTFVLKTDAQRAFEWSRHFAESAPEIAFRLWPDIGDPAQVRFLATWSLPPDLATTLPNLELLFSTGAGVDQFDLSRLPGHVQVVRMVEPGIVDGMVEYVTMAVLAWHRDLFAYLARQRTASWEPIRVQTAASRKVGVLGLGMLGQAVARKLAGFGFEMHGWSRNRREIPGVRCHAGAAALPGFLASCQALVFLLPLTEQTLGMLNASLFARLPRGATLINVARGQHLLLDDLRAALNDGQLAGAILDVTDPEPLPPDHWLWSDRRVVVTPHIASMTQPETAVRSVLQNLRRHARGEAMVGLVDRTRGY